MHGRFEGDVERRIHELQAEICDYIKRYNRRAANEDLAEDVNMLLAWADALAHALRLSTGAVWPFAGDPDNRTTLVVDARQGLTGRYMLLTLGTEVVRATRPVAVKSPEQPLPVGCPR